MAKAKAMFDKKDVDLITSKYESGLEFSDADVAKYVKKHLKFFDRFDIGKVTTAALTAHSLIAGDLEEPKEEKWTFF